MMVGEMVILLDLVMVMLLVEVMVLMMAVEMVEVIVHMHRFCYSKIETAKLTKYLLKEFLDLSTNNLFLHKSQELVAHHWSIGNTSDNNNLLLQLPSQSFLACREYSPELH